MSHPQMLFIPFTEFASITKVSAKTNEISQTTMQISTNICLSQKKIVPLRQNCNEVKMSNNNIHLQAAKDKKNDEF